MLRGSNGWTNSRDWKIAVIEDENQGAFTLPGGNIIITTGFLKVFRAEYELYYLFSFENALMNNEEIYFANIVSFIENTIDLQNLIQIPNPERALEIGIELYEKQSFGEFQIAEIDRLAMELICESGSWRNDGLIQFINRMNPEAPWRISRPGTFNRIDIILSNGIDIGCDNKVRERTPNFYIDNILSLIP